MRKYFMLSITVFMFLLTAGAYIKESNARVPQTKQPSISIDSKKFGQIKNIVWTSKYMHDNKSIIILSSKNTEGGANSYLYHLDINTGNSGLLAEFPAHKNLNTVVQFDTPLGINTIIAAFDKGVIKINYPTDDISASTQQRIEIPGFDTATSMDYKGNLIYTRENDNLLYVKNFSDNFFNSFFNPNTVKDISTYYLKPLYVANLNSLDHIISYTSMNNNRADLFAVKNGVPVNTLNTPIIKDVVSVQGTADSFGFLGMNILSDSQTDKKLNLFMLRRTIDKYNNDDYYSLDTIPYNTDLFGATPAVASTTDNDEFSIAYTSYDENHNGTLKICGSNKAPKVILGEENIFGPISMTEVRTENNTMTYILYFTLENNNIRIKICDNQGKLFKDITDMII